jgi:hypothetical protein
MTRCKAIVDGVFAATAAIAITIISASPHAFAQALPAPSKPGPAAGTLMTAPPSKSNRVDVIACRANPRFLGGMKEFGAQSFFSTSERFRKGLVLIDGPQKKLMWQHPSWKEFGWLAAIHYDERGNIYTVPAPRINVLENRPHQQNRVLRVDSGTGNLRLLAELPTPQGADLTQNPYGALGLAYDCETRLLYVTTIAGSTRTAERGRIYALDPDTGKVRFQLDGVDAMGLHLVKMGGDKPGDKRLYFGRIREPEVWSVAIAGNGAMLGEPRFEFSMEGLGPRGDDKARRINFTPDGQMLVWGIEFSVNLVAPTEKQQSVYRFRFNADTRQWERVTIEPYEP